MAAQSVPLPNVPRASAKIFLSIFSLSTLLWFALILCLLLASRIPVAPTYLVTFDEVNFALSIQKFAPLEHQPQPPGYPLYVALLRLLHIFIPQIERVFLVTGLLGSMLVLLLVWALGNRFIASRTGITAAMLLLFHPAFWFACLTNPIRVYLAAGAAGVALCLAKALSDSRALFWFSIAAFVFGIAAGFRPDLLFVLFPLMVYTAWRLRLRAGAIAIAAVAFLVPASVWLAALFASMGGSRAFIALMTSYWNQQGSTTSPLLGASFSSSAAMAYWAVIWTFAATLSWLWCLPFLLRRGYRILTKRQAEFLLVWLLPGFLFYALVHIGDPDHPLSLIPVTCIAGAAALTAFADTFAPRLLPIIVGVAVILNLLFFIKPINQTAGAASYESLISLDSYMEQVIESIDGLRGRGPVTVVSPAFISGWREVSYYFPRIPVLVIESDDVRYPAGSRWYRGQRYSLPVEAGMITLPGCGTIAWIDPDARPVAESGGTPVNAMPGVPVTDTSAVPNSIYNLRGFRFQTDRRGCAPIPASGAGNF
jgi:hypothetical protein